MHLKTAPFTVLMAKYDNETRKNMKYGHREVQSTSNVSQHMIVEMTLPKLSNWRHCRESDCGVKMVAILQNARKIQFRSIAMVLPKLGQIIIAAPDACHGPNKLEFRLCM